MDGLEALFAPRSVAILGASRDPAKLGYRLLRNVKEGGFAGALYAVNPAGEPILGVPTVPAVEALPDAIDLALVSLPAAAVPAAVKAKSARVKAEYIKVDAPVHLGSWVIGNGLSLHAYASHVVDNAGADGQLAWRVATQAGRVELIDPPPSVTTP